MVAHDGLLGGAALTNKQQIRNTVSTYLQRSVWYYCCTHQPMTAGRLILRWHVLRSESCAVRLRSPRCQLRKQGERTGVGVPGQLESLRCPPDCWRICSWSRPASRFQWEATEKRMTALQADAHNSANNHFIRSCNSQLLYML